MSTLREIVASVVDPEIPVLTISDLGILREVCEGADGRVHVRITPTYSGCPAVEAIRSDVVETLAGHGNDAEVEIVLSPAWTTDWVTEDGSRKLREFGIAPPQARTETGAVAVPLTVRCTRCGSPDTRELSRFGSTACKSLWVCTSCREPFDLFKTLR